MRLDRTALIHGLIAAANRERERRQAAERAAAEAAWQQLLDKIEDMGRRLVAVPRPGGLELAEQLARAKDWARVDELRTAADLARAEAVALCWTVSPESAMRLLSEYWSCHD